MFKLLSYVAVFAVFLIASSTAQEAIGPVDEQFVFTSTTDGPIFVSENEPLPTQAPLEELPLDGAEMDESMIETLEESPAPSEEPMFSMEPDMEMDTEMAEFAYNIGGNATENGKYEADPVEYLFGDTATFAVPDAPIGGAEPSNHDVYTSHRYGVSGSTWGYVLPVEKPGIYGCTLHFAETHSEFFTEEPNRTFSVDVIGDASDEIHEIRDMDVMVELGGAEFTAYTRTFENIAISSSLTIMEIPTIGDAFLSAVSCAQMAPLL